MEMEIVKSKSRRNGGRVNRQGDDNLAEVKGRERRI